MLDQVLNGVTRATEDAEAEEVAEKGDAEAAAITDTD